MSVAEDFLLFEEEQLEAHTEGFKIDNDDRAEWAVEKIAKAQANIERRKAFCQAKIDRLQAFMENENARDQATIDRMTALLHPYFKSLRPSLGKRRSYSLPSGTLQVRMSQPKFAREDEKLVTWAKAVDAETLVEVEEKPVWGEIKKRLKPVDNRPGAAVVDTQTGELVDGVTVAEVAGEEFSVKVEIGGDE